jgi:hypothetical protein
MPIGAAKASELGDVPRRSGYMRLAGIEHYVTIPSQLLTQLAHHVWTEEISITIRGGAQKNADGVELHISQCAMSY